MPKITLTNLEAQIIVCKHYNIPSPDDVIIGNPLDNNDQSIEELLFQW